MTSLVTRYLLVFAGALALAGFAAPPALRAAPAERSAKGIFNRFFGLSREEVENYQFSKTPIDSNMNWRIMHTDRELLKLLRQRAKFVLQNNPDSMAELDARIIIGITDRMGIGDGPQPPTPPTPPDPPSPPTPPTPPTTPEPPLPPMPPTPPTTPTPPATTTLIVPGDPDHSPLVARVEGTTLPGMPLGRPMTSDKIAVFRQWVRGGAQEAFYKQKVAPIVAANCLFCHSRSMPAARLSLETWADVRSRIARHFARK